MHQIRIESVAPRYQNPALLGPLLSLLTKVWAMGLLPKGPIRELTPATLRSVFDAVQNTGLLAVKRVELAPLFDEQGPKEPAASTMSALAGTLAALDESPVPDKEWSAMRKVFGDEELSHFVGASEPSLKRYARLERATPDPVADRLHYLAMVVADLSGSYNELGIRRWFERPRAQLDEKSPRQVLGRDWKPGTSGAKRVRELAKSLIAAGAT
jgi:hypothetical protein